MLAAAGAASGAPHPGHGEPDADSLCRRALERLERGSVEDRRRARLDLERATDLAGGRVDVLHAVASTWSRMGYLARARTCLDRIAKLTPDDAEAQIRLGLLWKWEWLASLEFSSYQKAIRGLARGAQLAPHRVEPRVAVTALALARGDTSLAYRAALSAVFAEPDGADAALALGCAAYRTGRLAQADSAIRAALPRLPEASRDRFAGPGAAELERPTAGEQNAATSGSVGAWAGEDPDLTTPEHEVVLDFQARVAHAVLLFTDPGGVRWDMRSELLVRYGVPARVLPPPPPWGDDDVFTYLAYSFPRRKGVFFAPEPVPYPFHMQTWIYPELGIQAVLWDRSLRASYELPVSKYADPDPRPNPALLAARPDLVARDDGRAVFRAIAPGLTPMDARGALAQFPGSGGARLVAHLEAPIQPSDHLLGTWVVVGTDSREAARGSGALSLSACHPGERGVVQFEAEVPAGHYRVHLAVENARRQRGVVRLETQVPSSTGGLSLSDLVLLCGAPAAGTPSAPVRLEPAFEPPHLGERAVSVYFEADRLTVDAEGRSRFSYRYTLLALHGREKTGRPQLEAAREEENVGPLRRQIVNVPIAGLRRGSYEFAIEVRDLASGSVASRSVRFELD